MRALSLESIAPARLSRRLRGFWVMTKPRVNSLIVFCAIIGMFLSVKGQPSLTQVLIASLGIWFVAGAAAAINCLIEQRIDARMARTRARPLATGEVNGPETLFFAALLGGAGLLILGLLVNVLTMWLTLATFVGYAVVYTIFLKPRTPQNIVIGGASGAMPPVLGWAAMTGEVSGHALLLFLIIFAWTPPHFWALALYRVREYEQAGLPMLPVTHGSRYTRLSMLLYSFILFAVSLLPFVSHMSGMIYLVAAGVLGGEFIRRSWVLYQNYSDDYAKKTFRFSIIYLTLIFSALLVDHYVI